MVIQRHHLTIPTVLLQETAQVLLMALPPMQLLPMAVQVTQPLLPMGPQPMTLLLHIPPLHMAHHMDLRFRVYQHKEEYLIRYWIG